MRGTIEGLVPTVPVLSRMPGVYHDDEVLRRFTHGLDVVLAPAYTTLDALWAYLDPHLSPEDFLDWLAGWVGIEVDDAWPEERRREIVAGAALLHRSRGTARGVRLAVELVTGGEVEIEDSGGTSWSRTPGSDLPGGRPASVHVTVRVPDAAAVDRRRLARAVADVKPAHVAYTIDVEEVA